MQQKIDLLTRPHTEQRKWMYSLSIQASEMDFSDTHQLKQFTIEFKALMKDLIEHAENEEMFILPLITKRFPQSAQVFHHDHPELKTRIQNLLKLIDELNQSPTFYKNGSPLIFNRLFNQFIGEYLLHLYVEEHSLLPILEEHYYAHELIGVMIAFKTYREGHKPDELKKFIQSMVEALGVSDLIELFKSIKKHTTDALFKSIWSVSKEALNSVDWLEIKKEVL